MGLRLCILSAILTCKICSSLSNSVDFTFWTSSNDYLGYQFKRNFTNIALALDNPTNGFSFAPHMYILNGSHWGCPVSTLPCKRQCSNSGRYCTVDPEYNLSIGLDGIDVVQEDLRSLCVWEYAMRYSSGYRLWWNYSVLWDENCGIGNAEISNFNKTCSFDQINKLNPLDHTGYMQTFVEACIINTGGYGYKDGVNTKLETETESKYLQNITSMPLIKINDKQFNSTSIHCPLPITTKTCPIFKAICDAFSTTFNATRQPQVCLSSVNKSCSDSERDCMGTCHGVYGINPCGFCIDSTTIDFSTYGQDCRGVCGGSYYIDGCGQCLSQSDPKWNHCLSTSTQYPTTTQSPITTTSDSMVSSAYGAVLSFPSVIDGALYGEVFDVAPAQFGYQAYGGKLEGFLILPANETYHKECPKCDAQTTSMCTNEGQEPLGSNPYIHFLKNLFIGVDDIADYILVIDRLDCNFMSKVKLAQSIGASGAIICDWRYENLFTMWTSTDIEDDINIPSVLLSNTDCQTLMQHLGVQNWDPLERTTMTYPTPLSMNWTIASIEWGLPHPDDIVEYELWTSSNDYLGSQFKHNFNDTAIALDKANDTVFTPHMYILNGSHWGCPVSTLPCKRQCSNSGRYCAVDPEYDESIGLDGIDVIQENLRSLCVWEYDKENFGRDDVMWWDYAVLWDENCGVYSNSSKNFHLNCSYAQMDKLKTDKSLSQYVKDCIINSGGYGYTDGVNTILKRETKLKYNSSIYAVPLVRVNGFLIHGNIDCNPPVTTSTCTVLAAICAGFIKGTQPDVCSGTPSPTSIAGTDIPTAITTSDSLTIIPSLSPTLEPVSSCSIADRDCNGICFGNNVFDQCGACLLPSSADFNACVGCDNIPNSGKILNPCGICLSPTTPNFDDYGKDCTGSCVTSTATTHYTDSCGQCLLPSDPRWNNCESTTTSIPWECIDQTATGKSGDFTVRLDIDCTLNGMILDIEYNAYKGNWFGIVLNDTMLGTAFVYTTGKPTEPTRSAALSWYFTKNHTSAGVEYFDWEIWAEWTNISWTEIYKQEYDKSIRIKYLFQPFYSANISDLVFSWAYGNYENDLSLTYHGANRANTGSTLHWNDVADTTTASPTTITTSQTEVPSLTPIYLSPTHTTSPTTSPTGAPSLSPTHTPPPTASPTTAPSNSPTHTPAPSAAPTTAPSWSPTHTPPPSASPTTSPTISPTLAPSSSPTHTPPPSAAPTGWPTPDDFDTCWEVLSATFYEETNYFIDPFPTDFVSAEQCQNVLDNLEILEYSESCKTIQSYQEVYQCANGANLLISTTLSTNTESLTTSVSGGGASHKLHSTISSETEGGKVEKSGVPLDLVLFIVIGVLMCLLCSCGGYVFYSKYKRKKNMHLGYVRNMQMDLEDEGKRRGERDHGEGHHGEGALIVDNSDQTTALAQTNRL